MLNKPRDVVSGDFYWMQRKGSLIAFAVADCTGHGVTGAFLSMLGMATLNEIVKLSPETKANEILSELRSSILNSLRQTLKIYEPTDGMNISFCILDLNTLKMQYAGAYHSLYIINNSNLTDYKGDKMPIGHHVKEERMFTNIEIQLQKNDSLYLFSDGYCDQLGGEFNRRIGTLEFQKQLLQVQDKSMKMQRKTIKNYWKNWKGKHDQIDDILIVGIKI